MSINFVSLMWSLLSKVSRLIDEQNWSLRGHYFPINVFSEAFFNITKKTTQNSISHRGIERKKCFVEIRGKTHRTENRKFVHVSICEFVRTFIFTISILIFFLRHLFHIIFISGTICNFLKSSKNFNALYTYTLVFFFAKTESLWFFCILLSFLLFGFRYYIRIAFWSLQIQHNDIISEAFNLVSFLLRQYFRFTKSKI